MLCINWTTTNTIEAISALCSLGTLSIAYILYKRFLVRDAKQQQLKVVLEFVSAIHSSKNNIEVFSNLPNTKGIIHHVPQSIFEMIEKREFKEDFYLYFYRGDALNWDFFNYYTHPLLPTKIAKQLGKFNMVNRKLATRSSAMTKNAILVGNAQSPIPGSETMYIETDDTCLAKTNEFREGVLALKNEILYWLNDYGITDINFNVH